MYQMPDGMGYFHDLHQYVIRTRETIKNRLQIVLSCRPQSWHRITSPVYRLPSSCFINFAKDNNISQRLIFNAMDIYERFLQEFRVLNHESEELQDEEITNHETLDMLLAVGFAIAFDGGERGDLTLGEIAVICQSLEKTHSLQSIRNRQWKIFKTIGFRVFLPSIMDLSTHVLMMIAYKYKYSINIEFLDNWIPSITTLYYLNRSMICDFLKSESDNESSIERKQLLWTFANGYLPFAAAVVILTSFVKLKNTHAKATILNIMCCVEEWLQVKSTEVLPIVFNLLSQLNRGVS